MFETCGSLKYAVTVLASPSLLSAPKQIYAMVSNSSKFERRGEGVRGRREKRYYID
jgi:hypothetical protein